MRTSGLARTTILVVVAAFMFPTTTSAKEPPAMIFVKEKCALCHGEDGSGDTPAGKQSGVHDFKLPEVQKLSDAEMAEVIADGKGKMPAFKARLNPDDINTLVKYVRELGSKK